jgi:hypothetical protein
MSLLLTVVIINYAVTLKTLIIGRLKQRIPYTSTLQLFWIIQAMATAVKYFDSVRENPEAHSGPVDRNHFHRPTLSIIFGISLAIAAISIYSVFRERQIAFWEVNREAHLLEALR